jgi:NAD(P)-dependent dehydrogenase (short-subunit alcohol dehydrogenase family)
MTEISFSGQTVIVTGAGRNLGRSHALEFARRGAAVVVNEIDEGLAEAVAEEITQAGGKAVACQDTVATADGAKHVVDTAVREFGTVDVLVNNAGVLRTGYLTDLSEEDIDIVLDVHLRAAFRMARLVWPLMTARNYGRVVMTSSGSGLFSHQGLSSYAAAKAGLYGLTKALAFEGEERGIRVNAILPVALTGFSPVKPDIPDMEKYHARYARKPVVVDDWRWGPPLISALVTYLGSSKCDYSGEAFSAVHGRYGRVFVGVADGWLAPDEQSVSAENVAAHVGQIRDLSSHSVPMWLFEEMRDVAERVDGDSGGNS